MTDERPDSLPSRVRRSSQGGGVRSGSGRLDVGSGDGHPRQPGRRPDRPGRRRRGGPGDQDGRRGDRDGLRPPRREPRRRTRTSGRDPVLQHRHGQGRRAGGESGRDPGPQRPRLLHRRGVGPCAWHCCLRRSAGSLPFATATAAGGWPNDDRSITGSLRRLRGQTLGIAGRRPDRPARGCQGTGVRLPDDRLRPVRRRPRSTPTCRWSTATSCSRTADALVVCAALHAGRTAAHLARCPGRRQAGADRRQRRARRPRRRGGACRGVARRPGRRRGARRPRDRAAGPCRRPAVRAAECRPHPAHGGAPRSKPSRTSIGWPPSTSSTSSRPAAASPWPPDGALPAGHPRRLPVALGRP